jgi:hypothetical protein
VFFSPRRIGVRITHNRLDMLANKVAKMRSDNIKRNTMRTTTMKLEKSANNNAERFLGPNESRRSAKLASIDSSKRTSASIH